MKRFLTFTAGFLALFGSAFAQGGDNCAAAQDVMSVLQIPYDNTASTSSGDAGICTAAIIGSSTTGEFHQDVWFKWTAPSTGNYTFTNNGIDGVLGIFDGDNCATSMIVECNDNVGTPDMVSLPATSGSSYLIVLGGWDPAGTAVGGGTIDISVTVPFMNDDCAGAEDVGMALSFPYDSTPAVTSGDAGICYTTPASTTGEFHNDVWFEWTAPTSGTYMASNNGIDGVLGVFDGNDCATSMIVECNDAVGAVADIVNFPTIAGNSYLIVLGGWNPGIVGAGTIDLVQVGGPPSVGVNFCTSTLNSSGSASEMSASGSSSVASNNLVLSAGPGPVGEPGVFYYGPTNLSGIPFGDGVRCVGGAAGTVVRIFPFVVADGTGMMSTGIDNTNPAHAQIAPGSNLHFQCWFRDPAAGMSGFNLSDGYTILFGI